MRDDVQLGSASFGLPLPVDPGMHTILVSAPGHADRSVSVTLKAGDAQSIALRAGDAEAKAPEAHPAGAVLAAQSPATPEGRLRRATAALHEPWASGSWPSGGWG